MTRWGRIIAFILIVALSFGFISTTVMDVADDITLGLDLQGGFEILYEVEPLREDQTITNQTLVHTQATLERRVSAIGVNEPEFSIEGDDRIRVKLAGIEDPDEARRMLSTEAHLTFRNTSDEVILDGDDIKEGSAQAVPDEANQPQVILEFDNSDKVYRETRKLLQQPLAIWLDFDPETDSYEKGMAALARGEETNLISAPEVRNALSNNGRITGMSSFQEAKELANLLNAGALPVQLEELSANSVGARLGEQAMDYTINAGMIGGILILLYMLVYYRLPGVIAAITLIAYVYLILLVFNWLDATLTLPGIAALVLGIGMAVDANIITNERIKEEIRNGKTIMSSFRAGSKRALGTIMDANITTIIAASVLFYFGSSAIQGFAVMLIASIILSVVTAVFGSRFLLGLLVKSRALDKKPRLFGVKESEISEL
ncbi:protein translocase subunit SecD [Caldalkalibacillus salinus]|uniref:protein translocase subunit SecD n=1 Tax=Caldalkalibacillus salinus TaxID=2803787 RepID=UPI001922F6CC|nr:protein translocase subunit SecD [Caldalkalibacillus salinus]